MTTKPVTAAASAPETPAQDPFKFDQASVDAFKAAEQAFLTPASEETAVETSPATETAPAEDPAQAADGDQSGTEAAPAEAGAAGTPPEAPKDPKPPRKSAEARIRELRRAQGDAERRAEALERELAEERAKNRSATPAKTEPPASGDLKEPDPNDYEYGDFDPKYRADVRAFDKAQIMRHMEAQRQEEAARARSEELNSKHMEQVEALDAEVGDYVEVVVQGAREGKWACPPSVAELILESDVGAKIAYHLAKNPGESQTVAAMTPLKQAQWFGKMEAQFTSPAKAPNTVDAGKPPKIPQAAPPVQQTRGVNGKFTTPSSSTDFAAFEKAYAHLVPR